MRVYAHLMPGDGKETARVLDEMFGDYRSQKPKTEGGEAEGQAGAV